MNGSILVLLLIVLAALALVGQCDVRHTAKQTPTSYRPGSRMPAPIPSTRPATDLRLSIPLGL
jgi:hypothetical protein